MDPDLFDICDDHDEYCRFDGRYRVFGHFWPDCPHAVLRHPAWRYIVRCDAVLLAGPDALWPHGYAAWVVDGVLALRRARVAKEVKRAQKAQLALSGGR